MEQRAIEVICHFEPIYMNQSDIYHYAIEAEYEARMIEIGAENV